MIESNEISKAAGSLTGKAIIQKFMEADVRTVVALPDIVTCDSLLWPIYSDSDLKLLPVCKEDEGISICAGLSYCDHRALLLIQHTGFLDSINAIRSIAVEYQLPIVMIVGLQGMESGMHPENSRSLGIRILLPICDALGLEYTTLNETSDPSVIFDLIVSAYELSRPVVIFLACSPK